MGLELVEILLEAEREFGVSLGDEEGGGLETAGELHARFVARLAERNAHPCLGAYVFYRLRRALVERLQLDRNEVYPARPLQELIPRRGRRAHWEAIGRSSGLDLPPLRRPRWVKWLVLSGLLLACVGCVLDMLWGTFSGRCVEYVGYAILLCVFLPLLLLLLPNMAGLLADCFPGGCRTVGEAVGTIVSRNYGDPAIRARAWTEDAVWARLQQIIADVTGTKPELVGRTSSWKDLGAG
jgi:hypothetical protein